MNMSAISNVFTSSAANFQIQLRGTHAHILLGCVLRIETPGSM
jgi:hypothetical protein